MTDETNRGAPRPSHLDSEGGSGESGLPRREFLRKAGKAAYMTPVLTLLSINARDALAQFGSPPPPPSSIPTPGRPPGP